MIEAYREGLKELKRGDALYAAKKLGINEHDFRRISKQEQKVSAFSKVTNKISDMKLDLAKITSSLEQIKNQSDQIQRDISRVSEKDVDIESIELELEKMRLDLIMLL